MANASAAITETPRALSRTISVRCAEWDSVRGNHQGQRSCAPRKQAEHKTASDKLQVTSKMSCYARAIHTGQSVSSLRLRERPLRDGEERMQRSIARTEIALVILLFGHLGGGRFEPDEARPEGGPGAHMVLPTSFAAVASLRRPPCAGANPPRARSQLLCKRPSGAML